MSEENNSGIVSFTVNLDLNRLLADNTRCEFGEETSFEEFVLQEIRAASIGSITHEQREAVRGAVNETFNECMEGAVKEAVEAKLRSFMMEEIVLTDKWGKPTFYGSMEDMLKKTFDDQLMHPVDSTGRRISGCVSEGTNTYVQYLISKEIKNELARSISAAHKEIMNYVTAKLEKEVMEIKKSAAAEAIAALRINV